MTGYQYFMYQLGYLSDPSQIQIFQDYLLINVKYQYPINLGLQFNSQFLKASSLELISVWFDQSLGMSNLRSNVYGATELKQAESQWSISAWSLNYQPFFDITQNIKNSYELSYYQSPIVLGIFDSEEGIYQKKII